MLDFKTLDRNERNVSWQIRRLRQLDPMTISLFDLNQARVLLAATAWSVSTNCIYLFTAFSAILECIAVTTAINLESEQILMPSESISLSIAAGRRSATAGKLSNKVKIRGMLQLTKGTVMSRIFLFPCPRKLPRSL